MEQQEQILNNNYNIEINKIEDNKEITKKHSTTDTESPQKKSTSSISSRKNSKLAPLNIENLYTTSYLKSQKNSDLEIQSYSEMPENVSFFSVECISPTSKTFNEQNMRIPLMQTWQYNKSNNFSVSLKEQESFILLTSPTVKKSYNSLVLSPSTETLRRESSTPSIFAASFVGM